MALVLADRVRETTTVTGTGTATLLGAVSGYQSFSAVGNSNTTYYVIANQSASEWEVGIGTYTSSGTTLSRDTVLSSSNSGSLVNFTAGTKDVFVDYPASKAVFENASGNIDSYPITGGTIDNTVIGGTTPAAGTFTTLTATGQTSLGGDSSLPALRVNATSGITRYLEVTGSTAAGVTLQAQSSSGNPGLIFIARGAGVHSFSTNGTSSTEQMRVSHTASAVNYVQVTGAATTASPVISAQGSDTNIPLTLNSKGNNGIIFQTRGAGTPRVALQLLDSGSASVNYLQIQSNISGAPAVVSALGSDTNIGMAFISKGTGAIDLAAGSSGVNISNGGTVTALTRTAGGSAYTSIPSLVISAPTTAGGVQATANPIMQASVPPSVTSGGTGYTVGDTLTVVGGTFITAVSLTVATVSAGVITGVTLAGTGSYTALPSYPASVTGGTGSGATFTFTTWSLSTSVATITNAGSGYVEQPTVSFSGGGGSGAAAYATVGGVVALKGLGTNFDVFTANANRAFRFYDSNSTGVNYWSAANGQTPILYATGSSNTSAAIITNGTGSITFQSSGGAATQAVIAHTASAVNYVQVTGAATTAAPLISVQGSDANVAFGITSKGTSAINFLTNSGNQRQLQINHTASAVNYFALTGSAAGSAPTFSVAGTDTNIDLTLTPKGTGNVRFGTYTGTALSIAGYIEIKDSGGTVRKLAVVA